MVDEYNPYYEDDDKPNGEVKSNYNTIKKVAEAIGARIRGESPSSNLGLSSISDVYKEKFLAEVLVENHAYSDTAVYKEYEAKLQELRETDIDEIGRW